MRQETAGDDRDDLTLPDRTLMLQVHLSEYAALMTRITNWISLQFAVWPILLAFFGIVAVVWHKSPIPHCILVWASGLVAQLIVLHWYHCAREMYDNVIYLETVLRPRVDSLIGNDEFWTYDRWLNDRRGRGVKWFEGWPAIISTVAVTAVAWHMWPWSVWDWCGLGLNALLVISSLFGTYGLVERRKMFGRMVTLA